MGVTHSSQTYATPLRPFDKNGRQRSCLGGAIVLPRRPRRNKSQLRSGASTLVQLILLQDWQRVLIRATLFPKEIHKSCVIKLYGIRWKVLPLHLACALHPPPKVVSVLSVGATATIPIQRASSTTRRRVRKWQFHSSINKYVEDQKELLCPSSVGQLENYSCSNFGDAATVTSTNKKNNFQNSSTNNNKKTRHFHFQQQKSSAFYQSTRSLVSLEQSIGDMASAYTMDDDDSTSTQDFGDDEYSTGDFLDKRGIILQLTPSGDILPMTMSLEPQDTSTTTYENEEETVAFMEFQSEPLIRAAAETQALLPIHIACLYQASSSVLEVLLQAHSMGALSAIVGMLPVHLVAVGWKAEPLVPAPSGGILAMAGEDDRSNSWTMQSLQMLVQAVPETVGARSSSHGLLPSEYIEKNPKDFNKEECISFLEQALKKGPFRDRPSAEDSSKKSGNEEGLPIQIKCASILCGSTNVPKTNQAPLFSMLTNGNWEGARGLIESEPIRAREWYYGMDKVSSLDTTQPPAVLWKRLALHVACVVSAPLAIVELLIRAYPQALELPDPHSGSTPLHLACIKGGSLPILRALLQARPGTTKAADARGRLPIHYAILSRAEYGVAELLIRHDPASVLYPDQEGKTPLQLAHHSYPAGSSVLGLLELVWM